jgi:hypothetical protein
MERGVGKSPGGVFLAVAVSHDSVTISRAAPQQSSSAEKRNESGATVQDLPCG